MTSQSDNMSNHNPSSRGDTKGGIACASCGFTTSSAEIMSSHKIIHESLKSKNSAIANGAGVSIIPQPTPSATTKTLENILHDFAVGLHEYANGRANGLVYGEELAQALAAINNYTTQAVIKELEAHISDLSYAVGYTDDQPFLKRQLELCKERLDELKRH